MPLFSAEDPSSISFAQAPTASFSASPFAPGPAVGLWEHRSVSHHVRFTLGLQAGWVIPQG